MRYGASSIRRPHDATFVIIDCNDQLAHHYAVAERHDTRTGLGTSIGHESGHQPGVEGANVAQRIPDVVRPCISQDFLAYRCHFALPRFCEPELPAPSGQATSGMRCATL